LAIAMPVDAVGVPPRKRAGDDEVKGDVQNSCAALPAGCRRMAAARCGRGLAADYTDSTN